MKAFSAEKKLFPTKVKITACDLRSKNGGIDVLVYVLFTCCHFDMLTHYTDSQICYDSMMLDLVMYRYFSIS